MSDIQLTKDADVLICLIYKCYLEKRQNNISKSSSKEFSPDEVKSFTQKWNEDDIYETLHELKNKELVSLDIVGDVTLTDNGIIYMENRFLNKIDKLIDYISKFIP